MHLFSIMSSYTSIENDLFERTPMFGLRLWVVIGIGVGTSMVLILVLLSYWLISTRAKQSSSAPTKVMAGPDFCKDIKEVVHYDGPYPMLELGGHILSEGDISEAEKELVTFGYGDSTAGPDITVVKCKPQTNAYAIQEVVNERFYAPANDGEKRRHCVYQNYSTKSEFAGPVSSIYNLSWGQLYTLRDLELATNYFADSNVLGEGEYGIVYQGMLPGGSRIALKSLLNTRGQAELEFKIEVEAIGRVRHKNLVHLLGYCVEGFNRMLVYEYVDNGSLDQWLHGPLGEENHIPWDIRMKIVYGTAKGLAYLHEDLEPKVVHRNVKSSNILLDSSWNAKVSDFGLAKLLDSRRNYVTTRVMGTFGYVAPEYASTGLLTERSDVFSFGVLMMEIITGREPVDYDRPRGEVKLVDWIKSMVASRRTEEILDPKLKVKPSTRALKRTLLVSLKCVDPDAEKRPKMGHVMYMLESNDFLS